MLQSGALKCALVVPCAPSGNGQQLAAYNGEQQENPGAGLSGAGVMTGIVGEALHTQRPIMSGVCVVVNDQSFSRSGVHTSEVADQWRPAAF